MSIEYALKMEHISKAFGPVQALKDVTFSARKGSVHSLCGENGAGKSTLMKVLAGVHQPDHGVIELYGKQVRFNAPKDALSGGVSMLYQELDLAGDMMVYENVFLGKEITKPGIPFMLDRSAMIEATRDLLTRHGFDLDPEAKVNSLTPGDCQIVELSKALMRNASIVVMDEPTSSLSEGEAARLFEIVRQLRDRGMTIIYISHRMEEVMSLSDDISILRDGEVVHSAPRSELTVDGIVKFMVGRELRDFYPARHPNILPGGFKAEELASAEGIENISFEVKKGEIVGMAGLVGAGRTECARAIFGVSPPTAGVLSLNGKKLHITSPSDAIAEKIAFLTEDRKRTGLCVGLSCKSNISLPNYAGMGMKYLLNLSKEYDIARQYGNKVNVKWASPDAPASSLSGGNQQKVLIGRWLLADPEFLIFDEPTRGIDVGAKKEVYTLLNELAEQGRAILVISSDLPELFGICDRILVLRRKRLIADLVTSQTTPEEVMRFATVEENETNRELHSNE